MSVAAETMAADIRSAIATGQLTEAEAGRLQGVLSEIVGDADLTQAYADGTIRTEVDGIDDAEDVLVLQQNVDLNSESELVRKVIELGDKLLDMMELSGGHTIERHVGKSIDYLVERSKTLKGKGASSYYNKSIAIAAIQDAIWQHAEKIKNWLQNSNEPRLTINTEHNFDVGKGIRRNTEELIDKMNQSTTILKKERNDLGFVVITSYPTF